MNVEEHPDWKSLPECIKTGITPKQYSWLLDSQRENFVEKECLPDVEGED